MNPLTTPEKEASLVKYTPLGAQHEVKLSVQIVRNLIATPTKSGKTCSEKEATRFIALCVARRLSPFEGDCFLIGYDGKDGTATFSLITAHQAFLKRAELHPEFDGMKSGVIVQDDDGKTHDLEGDFHTDDLKLLGGWAIVFFRTRKVPMSDRLHLKRFQKTFADGQPMGRWKDDPEGLIVKCAESSALRKAFPTLCGGLYLRDEVEAPGARATGDLDPGLFVEVNTSRPEDSAPGVGAMAKPHKLRLGGATPPPASTDDDPPELKPVPMTPVQELEDFVLRECESNFTRFQQFGLRSGHLPTADSMTGFGEIPLKTAIILLRAKAGLKAALHKLRDEEAVAS